MTIRAVWMRHQGYPLGGVEWLFLLFGLAALDLCIWINTSSSVYEAYEDWAFDQDLRGLPAPPWQFTKDEVGLLRSGKRVATIEPRQMKSAAPRDQAPDVVPSVPTSLIGRLKIPNLQFTAMVEEGADARTLRAAVGHIPGTALPGKRGNVGLAGHRDTVFRPLRNIRVHDAIEFTTQTATYRYQVESTRIVSPRDVQVLAPTGGESLTLVTCYPFYYVGSAPKRFVVRANLVSRTGQSGSPQIVVSQNPLSH